MVITNSRPGQQSRSGDDLQQSLDDLLKFLGADAAQPFSEALRGERANLRDFDPRRFWEPNAFHPQGKGQACTLWLARQRESDCGPTVVEDIMANHQNWTLVGLLVTADWVQVGPVDLSS
jgi:hypothetical protein